MILVLLDQQVTQVQHQQCLVLPDLQVQLATQDLPDQLEILVQLVQQDQLEPLAHKDLQDLPVLQALQVLQVLQH